MVETVAQALYEIISRVGVFEIMHSDLGATFTSEVMKETSRLMKIKQTFTPPYSPRCNATVERYQQTLKQVLKKMSVESPEEWDVFLPGVLFAIRDTPSETTGYSPFQMI